MGPTTSTSDDLMRRDDLKKQTFTMVHPQFASVHAEECVARSEDNRAPCGTSADHFPVTTGQLILDPLTEEIPFSGVTSHRISKPKC